MRPQSEALKTLLYWMLVKLYTYWNSGYNGNQETRIRLVFLLWLLWAEPVVGGSLGIHPL